MLQKYVTTLVNVGRTSLKKGGFLSSCTFMMHSSTTGTTKIPKMSLIFF